MCAAVSCARSGETIAAGNVVAWISTFGAAIPPEQCADIGPVSPRSTDLDDLAVLQRHAAVHAAGELDVVGGDRRRPGRTGAPAPPAPRTHRPRCADRDCRSARRPAAPRGALATARAIATRCCSPPDSSDGRCSRALADPQVVEQFRRPPARLRLRQAADHLRHHHVLERRELRQQMVELVDEADVVAADARALVVGQRPQVAVPSR